MPESVQSCYELSTHFPVFFFLRAIFRAVHGWFALQTKYFSVFTVTICNKLVIVVIVCFTAGPHRTSLILGL